MRICELAPAGGDQRRAAGYREPRGFRQREEGPPDLHLEAGQPGDDSPVVASTSPAHGRRTARGRHL